MISMKKQGKYEKKNNRNRDCTECIHFQGMISKNYFVCDAEMHEYQEKPACHDIYDKDVMFKGKCNLFIPLEVNNYVPLHDYDAMDCSIKEDDQSLPNEE